MTDSQNEPVIPAVSRRRMLAGAGVLATTATMAGKARAQSPATTAGAASGTAGNPGVALVTGSSRGIGAATARQLGRDGYRVVVNCVVNTDLAARVAADIEADASQAIWRQADVRDSAAVRALFDAAEEAFGGVDVVVANAGVMHLAPFAEMTDEDVNHMIDVNIRGSFHTLREAARRVRDGGRIFALSSTIAKFRTETYGPYAASKMARSFMLPFWRRNWPAGTYPSMRSRLVSSIRPCSPTERRSSRLQVSYSARRMGGWENRKTSPKSFRFCAAATPAG